MKNLRIIAMAGILPLIIETACSQTPGRQRRQERRQQASERYPELSQRLENPLARILVLPTSFEYKHGAGALGGGEWFAVRIAPRVPFILNEDWHILSKTDVAWVTQEKIFGAGRQEGMSDLVQTFFFSPDRSLGADVYWGLGPTFVLPTASDDFLGTEKLSIGPSFGFFRERDNWTLGSIINHVWSVAGTDSATDVNASRIELLVAYTTPTSTTIALGAEVNYNWENSKWLVPIELRISQLTLIRERPVQWSLGVQHFALSEGNGPKWGAIFQITLPLQSPRWGKRR